MELEGKNHIVQMLREEFQRWNELLAGLNEGQITARQLPAHLSIKDVVAHLMAWQQLTIARLEAARTNTEPVVPGWAGNLEPDAEENLEQINARIHETYRDRPWETVFHDWRSGFLHLIELTEAIPDEDLLQEGKYPWIGGAPLSAVLLGTFGHHHEEHLEPLLAWLRDQESRKASG